MRTNGQAQAVRIVSEPCRGDSILEQNGKLAALEIQASSTTNISAAAGIRAFRDSLKAKSILVRSTVLHAGPARPLDTDLLALPWGWMVAAE